jgi:hypothetical protein
MVGLARGLRPSGYRREWLARDVLAGPSRILVPVDGLAGYHDAHTFPQAQHP